MGYLLAGAMKGASQEYLKQSDERRANEYQAIRDRRLSELKKDETKFASDLAGEREAAAYEREKGDFTAGYGDDVYRGGERVARGRERPVSSGSSTQKGNLITMISGDQRTFEELRKNWEGQAFTKDDFGNPIRNPDVPEFDQWFNDRVAPQHRINPRAPEQPVTEPSTAALDQARKEASDKAGWLTSDTADFGPDGREAWIKRRAKEIDAEKGGKQGGMLTQGADRAREANEAAARSKPVKLKSPLSRAAAQDPVQMYDELMAQFAMGTEEVGEQDIIDTIRAHFRSPDWNPPADALK